jgi:hypothetical protein
MIGFNLSPVPHLSGEQVAAMGLAGFKPPQAMNVPSGPGFSMPSGGGGDGGLGAGMAGLGAGLKVLGPLMGGGISEQGAVGPGGLAGAISSIDALKPDANGVWQQPKMPTDIGYGQGGAGGSFLDPLTGLIRKLFG